MIRTSIVPTVTNFNLVINIPSEYLGEELEVMVYKKREGFTHKIDTPKIKISAKYKGIFTKKDTESFDNHTKTMRSEWENI